MSNLGRLALAVALTLVCAVVTYAAFAQDAPAPSDKQIRYSPYPKHDFPNQEFLGDTRLHTSRLTVEDGEAGTSAGRFTSPG